MNRTACQFAIVRFAPFVETGEFANAGVVLLAENHRFFDFRLATRRYARITNFFAEIEKDQYRTAMASVEGELSRVKNMLDKHGWGRHSSERDMSLAQIMFAELTRERESIIRLSNPGVVLAEDPAKKLQALFDYYVERSFVTPKYRDTILEQGMRDWFRAANLQNRFQSTKVGDSEYEVSFPFVEMTNGVAAKIIKPLHLGQRYSTQIIEKSGTWAFRIQELIKRARLPEQTLFALEGPTCDADPGQQSAFRDAKSRLKDTGVTLANADDYEAVMAFATQPD